MRQASHPPSGSYSQRGGALGVILAILGGLLLVALIATCVTLYVLSRYVKVDVQRTEAGKQVAIETPLGGLKVRKADDIAQELNLPVYPGARASDENASIQFWGGTEDHQEGFDFTIAQYFSDDSLDQVDAWYRENLTPDFKREPGRLAGTTSGATHRRPRIERDAEGVVYIRESSDRTRGVGLERRHGEVRIVLFDLWEARGQ
ncbi:MAG: hypothetical protein HY653_02255 [Acidobacteria bacterium]|nr:hypothetical protein [Acidobacteriota bacterium]